MRENEGSVAPGSATRWICGALLAVVAGCGGGGTTPAPNPPGPTDDDPTLAQLALPGGVVAKLEVQVGTLPMIQVRAVVPVPRETLRRGAQNRPFRLRDSHGVLAPTQVEVVAQRALDLDGADAVEVTALVEPPLGAQPGDRVQYDLVWQDTPHESFMAPLDGEDLAGVRGGILLRARDAHGHIYEADVTKPLREGGPGWRVEADGRIWRRDRVHTTMEPVVVVGGATPTLPHLFGVHAFVTQHAWTSAVRLDLHVHNAFTGRDANDASDDALGDIVFEGLDLVLPAGWRAIPCFVDPQLGTTSVSGDSATLPIVKDLPGDDLHLLPQLSRFQRRFVLAPLDELDVAQALAAEEGLAFAVPGPGLFSWWNPDTARWWPQKTAFPDWGEAINLQLRQSLAGEHAALVAQVAAGAASPGGYPIQTGALGWAHPFGTAYGGMTGGDEIYLWDGVDLAAARSREGVRTAMLRMRLYVDRQPNVLFELDGDPMRVEGWTAQGATGPVLPVWWFNGPLLWVADPFGYQSADQSQSQLASSSGRMAPYATGLRNYQPIDYQHFVRHTRTLKTLCWIANDPLAKLELEAQAEGWRLSYPLAPQNGGGAAIETGYLADRRHVDANPGDGVDFGRGEGWGVDTLVAWHALAPNERRDAIRPFFALVAQLLHDGQVDCTGSIMAQPASNMFGGQHRVRTQTETAIVEHALLGMRESALARDDAAAAALVSLVLERSYYSTIGPTVWRADRHGPLFKVAVGPYDDDQASYCGWVPPGGETTEIDDYLSPSSFAHAWRETGDEVFLDKAAELFQWSEVSQVLDAPLSNWRNRLALQRLAQDLLAQ